LTHNDGQEDAKISDEKPRFNSLDGSMDGAAAFSNHKRSVEFKHEDQMDLEGV